MHTHYYLVSVAELEFNALVKETEHAIKGLKVQRESVLQAIEAIHQAKHNPGELSDETLGLVTSLLDRLGRLNAILDQVMCEIEQA